MTAIRPIALWVIALGLTACQSGGEDRSSAETTPSVTDGTGILIVAYASDSADTFQAVGTDSLVVLDWLRQVADSAGVTVELKEYYFGLLIEAIGPRRNGDGGYWLYEVNGGSVPEAASSHRVASSDTVRFFFEGL